MNFVVFRLCIHENGIKVRRCKMYLESLERHHEVKRETTDTYDKYKIEPF